MKHKILALCGLILMCYACSLSTATAAPQSATTDNAAITTAVKTYQSVLDAQWTNTSCALSRCLSSSSRIVGTPAGRDTFTQVERENLKIRDELLADGTWFAVAKSDVTITQATPQPDGSAFVIATITTTLTEGGKDGKPTPGNLSDAHTITLKQVDGKYYVMADIRNDSGSTSFLSSITIKGQIVTYVFIGLVALAALLPWLAAFRGRGKHPIENKLFVSLTSTLVMTYMWWLTRNHAHVTGVNGARRVCKGSYSFMLNPRVAKILSWSNDCITHSWVAMVLITAAALALLFLELWVTRRYIAAPSVAKRAARRR